LARIAVKGKSETACVTAIRELLDRGFGKATQFVAAEAEALPGNLTAEELRMELLAEFAGMFPEFQFVPVKQPTLIAGPKSRESARKIAPTDVTANGAAYQHRGLASVTVHQ